MKAVGKQRIVLDLSCKRKDDDYFVVTDRWQKFTETLLSEEILFSLSEYCDEFLIHAVDVEGKNSGIEKDLVKMLGSYCGNPVTYAGGVHSYEDIDRIRDLGKNRINFTIGSALDLFGGELSFKKVNIMLQNN